MNTELSDPLKPLSKVRDADERQPFLVQTLEQLHAGLSILTLDERVPVGVRQLFETAKNARLYTYFVYPFHQLAEMVAYQALERALKERWNMDIARLPSIDGADFEAPGLADLLSIAVARGWIRREGFSSRQHRAYLSLMSERSHAAFLAMRSEEDMRAIPEPSEEELYARAEQVDVSRLLANHLPELRNQLAHGSARLSPTSDLVLSDVRDAIGMVFDGTASIEVPSASEARNPPGLHGAFKAHLRDLEAKRRILLAMQSVTRDSLPAKMPMRGVYLLSEEGRHLYVGRSNRIRQRLCRHCRPSAKHNMASFAFQLAKEKAGIGPATYKKGQGRADVANQELFANEFAAAKRRIRLMQVRYVEETVPIRQALLESYVVIVHATPYNDFETH